MERRVAVTKGNVRLRSAIKAFLAESSEPRTTTEILEHINNTSKYGTTSNCLVNLLAKTPGIVKVGQEKIQGTINRYNNSLWAVA